MTGYKNIIVHLRHSNSVAMWLAYVIAYKNCVGSSRIVAFSETASETTLFLDITDDMSAIMFSFRSYDDYEFSVELIKSSYAQPYLLCDNFNRVVRSINHMGWHEFYTQETLNAYAESVKHGFKWVEGDIQWTSDNKPVLLHGTDLSEVTNSTGNINSITLADAQALTCKDGTSHIASLEELMAFCKNTGTNAYIEIKYSDRTQGKMNILGGIVKSYGMERNVVWLLDFLSVTDGDVDQLMAVDDEAEYCYVVGQNHVANYMTILSNYKTTYPNSKPFINVYSSYIDDALVAEARQNNLRIEAWTLDKPSEIVALDPYVSGVTSNTLIAGKIIRNHELFA